MNRVKKCVMEWKTRLQNEFKLKNFGLEHDQPSLFVTAQYGPKHILVLWTIIAALYHSMWIVLQPVVSYVKPHYFIYLTNQGYILLTFTCMCHCASTMYVHCWRWDILEGECKYLPWYLKSVWIMSNITNTMAVIITIAYYGLLRTDVSNPVSIEKHALISVYVLLNICITAMPIRIYHLCHPMAAGIAYVVFSVIYQCASGRAIYINVLDLNNIPNTMAVACSIVLVLVPISHVTLYGIYVLRISIASKLNHKVKDYSFNIDEEKLPKLPDLYIRHSSFTT